MSEICNRSRSVFTVSGSYIWCATKDDLVPNVNLAGIAVSQDSLVKIGHNHQSYINIMLSEQASNWPPSGGKHTFGMCLDPYPSSSSPQ